MRTAICVTVTSLCAVFVVFISATAAILLTLFLKSVLSTILRIIATIGEVGIATVAAFSSGFTISLTVVLAAATSAVTFPPTQIEARLAVSVAVATASIVTSALALFAMTSFQLDVELAVAVVTTAAMSVGFASAWAVGVMSLIERETHNVGLKMTSLLQAVRHNQYHVLKVLVRLPFGNQAEELSTALLYAVKAGFVRCTEVLLRAGADPNTQDAYDNTPLICACQVGSEAIVRMLIEAHAQVDFRNTSRETALHHCAKYGHARCTAMLLASGADPRVQDQLEKTPLMLAARHAPDPEPIVRVLLAAGSDVNALSADRWTALHYAARRGLDIRDLLAAGAKPDVADLDGNTPLHVATAEGHDDVIATLLENGADANAANYVMATPLHLASCRGHVTCVETLVRHGADPRAMDNAGNYPINHGVLSNKPSVVLFFLRRNYFPGARSRDRIQNGDDAVSPVNPLRLAVEKNHYHLARILVQGGCRDLQPLREQLLNPEDRAWHDQAHLVNYFWLRNRVQQPPGLLEQCRLAIRRQLDNPETDCQQLPIPKQLRQLLALADLAEFC